MQNSLPAVRGTQQRPEFLVLDVEDVTRAGHAGQRHLLAGTQGLAAVRNGRLGGKTLVGQLQQTHAPGVGIAMLLGAEQVAVGGLGVAAGQDRHVGLEDLVVGADADGGEILLVVAVGVRATAWWTMLWTVPRERA